jgi:predicted enzyme related to lactoylglutathione lyase
MKKIMVCLAMMLMVLGVNASSDNKEKTMNKSDIAESYVMLYYKSLDAPRNFYANILGLEASYEDDWVSLYRITENSFVGTVKEGEAAYHKVQNNNAVMLSLVVDDVDAWYKKITAHPEVLILKEIYNNENAPIRAFLVEDPGGYSLEVFQWVK